MANGFAPLFDLHAPEREGTRVDIPPGAFFSINLRKIFKTEELRVLNLKHAAQNIQNK